MQFFKEIIMKIGNSKLGHRENKICPNLMYHLNINMTIFVFYLKLMKSI